MDERAPDLLLKIEGIRPREMPYDQLRLYLAAIRGVLGVGRALRLVGVEDASTGLAWAIEADCLAQAERNAADASAGTASRRVQRSFDRLRGLAANDHLPVRLLRKDDTEIFSISVAADDDRDIGPIRRDGYLQGRVVGIVGVDDTKHLQLLDGDRKYTHIVASEHLAAELGQHLFKEVIRLHGQGVWWRRAGVGWGLERFSAYRWEQLDQRPLTQVVSEIRASGLSHWHEDQDPWGTLAAINGAS